MTSALVFALRFIFAVPAALLAAGPAARPNVLFITIDDLKPALGAYGNTHAVTPHLDRLAARGVTFTAAYAQQAVCSPSRNTALTGLRPDTLRVYDLETFFRTHRPGTVTLPQFFKQHGWHTESIGKVFHTTHGNRDDEASWSVPSTPSSLRPAEERARARDRVLGEPWKISAPGDTLRDTVLADTAIARLAALRDRPFFLALGFLKPHLPFVAPEKFWRLHDPARLPAFPGAQPPAGAPDFAPTKWNELRRYRGLPADGPLTDAQAREAVHGYYAAVSYIDSEVGRVLDALDQLGLRERTIVVVWGDHGFHLGDLGLWCKHTNYEQATRVPLIFDPPGDARAGARHAGFAELADLFPTLAELAGLPVPVELEGASLAPHLADPAAPGRAAAYSQYPRPGHLMGRAVRTATHRYVEWRRHGADWSGPGEIVARELYAVPVGGIETENLADRPESASALAAHAALLVAAFPVLKSTD